jgi:hypothetical protein
MLAPDHMLAGRVGAAYHLGNTRFRKPDPRVFDELLAETGFAPGECVYVGDSPGDAIAAGGAGIRFIACLQSGVRRLDEFDPRFVTASVDAFPDLVAVVDRLQGPDHCGHLPRRDSNVGRPVICRGAPAEPDVAVRRQVLEPRTIGSTPRRTRVGRQLIGPGAAGMKRRQVRPA